MEFYEEERLMGASIVETGRSEVRHHLASEKLIPALFPGDAAVAILSIPKLICFPLEVFRRWLTPSGSIDIVD
ncbi:MAG TPA: hypothetical protein DD856_15035 [Sulfobacillus sp.]|nr:hypothetical protein [Sulfobacillus sp.]